MQMTISDQTGTTAKILLVGKLDILGAEAIAMPFATLAGSKTNIIVDMTGVTFLASIGIRHLVSATKVLSRRGGKLILVNPCTGVRDVLETSGLTTMMPVVATDDEARALVG